jgi:hypothetical protein
MWIILSVVEEAASKELNSDLESAVSQNHRL